MIEQSFRILPHTARFTGAADAAVRFTLTHQLLDARTWADFVRVYTENSDDFDEGWRNEYWGKMMRGACLTYEYCGDPQLYDVLTKTVRDLLKTQRPDGRFSTYSEEKQLRGWDVWGRKYIMTSLLHYYRICKDAALKTQVLAALRRHADALIEKVGDGAGQVRITDTSEHWGGVNSSSVLEPFVDLYRTCGERKYLDFAEHIISCGGCRDGDLIDLALKGEKAPFEYPETKAYETISFFEGLLAYYEVTGKERYLEAAEKFARAVANTDLTAIGCCGCTHELFDHSGLVQTEIRPGIMQETCVTVTWMRLMMRLYQLTGKAEYDTRFERSARNALYGSLNTHMEPGRNGTGRQFAPLPFDSYSPLTRGRRGKAIGGLKEFAFGGFYSCCTCIAAAGTALVPLTAVMKSASGWVFSAYETGEITDGDVAFSVETAFPRSPRTRISVRPEAPKAFSLRLRIPERSRNAALYLNGLPSGIPAKDGFFTVERTWENGDSIELRGEFLPEYERLNGLTAVFYGPTLLAREAKESETAALSEPVRLSGTYEEIPSDGNGPLEFSFARADGEPPLLLKEYAFCGKRWSLGGEVSVWNDLRFVQSPEETDGSPAGKA